jgi:hypothetical protein
MAVDDLIGRNGCDEEERKAEKKESESQGTLLSGRGKG